MIYFILLFIICLSIYIVWCENAVQSVFALIFVFLLSVNIFLILGASFLAILLLIVYVGAISTLFLFVVMMLNLRVLELSNIFSNYFFIIILVGFSFNLQFFISIYLEFFVPVYLSFNFMYDWINLYDCPSNIELIGQVLFNNCEPLFLISGLILLTSMIGSIVLTIPFFYKAFIKKSFTLYRWSTTFSGVKNLNEVSKKNLQLYGV